MLTLLGAERGEGRSYLAANLAIVFSQLGERTLLVDADMREPRQHFLFYLKNRIGFSTLLAGRSREEAIVRIPDLEAEGYELFFPADAFVGIWQRLTAGGATPGGLLAWEIARIENGRPEWGIDIDDTTIPQEANQDELHAISYTKGCYTGQEVVARIHFRGHVNRHLRGLLLGHHEPPAERSPLLSLEGRQIGDVRSSALSPRLGALALVLIRREVEMGSTVIVEGRNGPTQGQVVPLPFVQE